MKYLNASEELDELLSFDLFEKAPRGEEEVWRSWFIMRPTWSIIRNAIVAYNNVLSERGPSGDLRTAQRYVLTLVNWFQIFVRTDPTLHQRLKEHLLGFYGTKEEAMKEYERYLDILRRFTILKAIGEEEDTPEDVSSQSEISSSESSVPLSVLAALGVGGALLLWKARSKGEKKRKKGLRQEKKEKKSWEIPETKVSQVPGKASLGCTEQLRTWPSGRTLMPKICLLVCLCRP